MRKISTWLIGLLLLSWTAAALASPDASDIWYQGFLKRKLAGEQIEKGDYLAGLNSLNEAFVILKSLAIKHPDFQPEAVSTQLRSIAEQRHDLKGMLKLRPLTELDTLTKELESLDEQLADLQRRREEVREQIEQLNRRERIPPPELPEFHEKTEDGESHFHWPSLNDQLFPEGRIEMEDETRRRKDREIQIEPAPPAAPPVPDHWIPRPFEGEMFYLIPLK